MFRQLAAERERCLSAGWNMGMFGIGRRVEPAFFRRLDHVDWIHRIRGWIKMYSEHRHTSSSCFADCFKAAEYAPLAQRSIERKSQAWNATPSLKAAPRQCKVLAMAASSARAKHPHPGPLPEGEGDKGRELRIADYPAASTRKGLIAGALILGSILIGLDMSIVNVALPYMQSSFHVGVDRISWVVISYFAAVGVVLPLTGWIATRVGRKRYLLVSVLTFVIASALCGLAGGIGQMVVFRI